VELFNRRSIYGKAVVATFNDRDAAKLMGINTGPQRIITTVQLAGHICVGDMKRSMRRWECVQCWKGTQTGR